MLLLLRHLLVVVLLLIRILLLRVLQWLRILRRSLPVEISVLIRRLLLLYEIIHLILVWLFLRSWSWACTSSSCSFWSCFCFLVADLHVFHVFIKRVGQNICLTPSRRNLVSLVIGIDVAATIIRRCSSCTWVPYHSLARTPSALSWTSEAIHHLVWAWAWVFRIKHSLPPLNKFLLFAKLFFL